MEKSSRAQPLLFSNEVVLTKLKYVSVSSKDTMMAKKIISAKHDIFWFVICLGGEVEVLITLHDVLCAIALACTVLFVSLCVVVCGSNFEIMLMEIIFNGNVSLLSVCVFCWMTTVS